MMVLDEVAHHPGLTINSLLSVNPVIYGELGQAVRRSTHWSHLGGTVDDWTEGFLLTWMAAETLTRVSVGDSLGTRWLAVLGFPSGRLTRQFKADDLRQLAAIPSYRHWRKRLQRLMDRARVVRNSIAHTGFRELDVGSHLSADDRLLVSRIFALLVPRLTSLALNGLSQRILTIRDLWRQFGQCLYLHRQVPLATEVAGTIIYSLEQAKGPWDK
jgi:hypothetical protein